MQLIADSGSTKTDWSLINGNQVDDQFSTRGINPYFQDEEYILNLFKTEFPETVLKVNPDVIYFYGAGCSSPMRKERVEKAIKKIFPDSDIRIEHDLLGAARALCGNEKGIATILGTGSNSCLYDGEKIVEEKGGIGYILGDEGSGSYMGKRLVRDIFYELAPEDIKTKFLKENPMTREQLVERVYRGEAPNRYLAGFAQFIGENIGSDYIKGIVRDGFNDFFRLHITQFEGYENLQMHSVGSIGLYFRDLLEESAEEYKVTVGKIIDKPINALVQYHMI